MPGAAGRALDRRKASILRAIVREYVKSGQPVSSKALVERYKLQVSAATIRNDMGVLEELGYIVQPHTSAGRIPTDLGYRWFVDNWPGTSWPEIPDQDRRAIDVVLDAEFRGLDYTLDSTSHVLSTLTEAAGIAMAPPSRRNQLRRIDLIMRDARRATMLLVAHNGEVEQGVVEFSEDMTEDLLDDLARDLNVKLKGLDFQDLAKTILGVENVAVGWKAVAEEIEDVMEAGASQRIFRGGTANILSRRYFSDMETVQEIVDALEHPRVLSGLMTAVTDSATVLVFIGQEVPVEQMRACTVIFAPYGAGDDRQGSVGVIGPTRMDYPHTIAAVEAVARRLSTLLE
ncbi:MAG TPA: heat-inducible transcriptional repressor HrcA, partial [Acidimicrobiales bacterium]|nr:heat-inducible transcriptional repressor HrcA [Acidimicrobiales bacterium]